MGGTTPRQTEDQEWERAGSQGVLSLSHHSLSPLLVACQGLTLRDGKNHRHQMRQRKHTAPAHQAPLAPSQAKGACYLAVQARTP